MLRSLLLCLLTTTVTAISISARNLTYLQLPTSNITLTPSTANATLRYSPWPIVPFQALIVDTVIEYISCSPVEAELPYLEDVLFALDELVDLYIKVAPSAPAVTFHCVQNPLTLEFRITQSRPILRGRIGLILEHVKSMFIMHGPAVVSARMLYEGASQVGGFTLWMPFQPPLLATSQ